MICMVQFDLQRWSVRILDVEEGGDYDFVGLWKMAVRVLEMRKKKFERDAGG